MAKYRIGDRVYPIDDDALDHLRYLYMKDEFDRFDFVGIVTEASRYGDYSVAWLNRDRTEENSNGIKTAWWDERELTDDRERFLRLFD